MFFTLSKMLWWCVTPSNLLIACVFLGLVLGFTRFGGFGRSLAIGASALLVLAAIAPLSIWLREPLENRFPPLPRAGLNPDGIILLGGSINESLTEARGNIPAVRFAGARITEFVALAHSYPAAKLIISGGYASVFRSGDERAEADITADLVAAMGIERSRIIIENKSLNTDQNAENTLAFIQPKADERWVVITSAYHMPRSVGIFRKRGLEVVPYPVDYVTLGTWAERLRPVQPASEGLRIVDTSVREYIGLVAYYLTGKTSALFPAPR